MELYPYMKETFSLFEEINMDLLEEYHSLLDFDLTPKQYAIVELVYHERKITINEIGNVSNNNRLS